MLGEGKGRHEGGALHHARWILRFVQRLDGLPSDGFFVGLSLLFANVLQAQAGRVECRLVADGADPAFVMPRNADGEVSVGKVHLGIQYLLLGGLRFWMIYILLHRVRPAAE